MILGHVHNGVVVPDSPCPLQEGTQVAIQPIKTTKKRPTVSRALARLAGKAKGLPPDASENIDHVLYGHAKR